MRDLFPIYRALEFIEAHLRAEVTVAEMAASAGYSLYHFIRTFDQVVLHTPYDYLMRRRLSEAARDLVSGDRRVVDIALDYCFGSHEVFSRAFKRLFGLQPVQWRERGAISRRLLMPPLSMAYLEHIHRAGSPRPEVIERGACHLAGLMAPLAEQPGAAEPLWGSLGRVLGTLPPVKGGAHYYGVTTYLDGRPEEAFYLAAVEHSLLNVVSPFLVTQALPAGKYLRFEHRGSLAGLPLSLDYLYHTWLPKAGLRPAHPMEIVSFGPARPWLDDVAGVMVLLPV